MNFIYGNGIRKISKGAGSSSSLYRMRQSLAKKVLCAEVSGFLYQKSLNYIYEIRIMTRLPMVLKFQTVGF